MHALTEQVRSGPPLDVTAPPLLLKVDCLDAVVIPVRAHLAPVTALAAVFDRTSPAARGQRAGAAGDLRRPGRPGPRPGTGRRRPPGAGADLRPGADRPRPARRGHPAALRHRAAAPGRGLDGVVSARSRAGSTRRSPRSTTPSRRSAARSSSSRTSSSPRCGRRSATWCASTSPCSASPPRCAPRVRSTPPSPRRVADQLLPVLREAISNVARHALAERAEVDVQVSAHELVLTVSDDGSGLPDAPHGERPAQRATPRRRPGRLAGALPGAPRGTTLVWRVPLD